MSPQTGVANRHLIRQINKAVILRLIRELAPVSRTDLVDAASLSPATVSGITAELIRDDLIVEEATGRSTGGRRPIPLAINRDAGLAIGIKLTEDRIVLVVTDFQGTIVDRRETPLLRRHPEAVVATIAAIVQDVQTAHSDRRLFGIGLGLAGAIDRVSGLCRFSPFLGWRDVPLQALLEDATRLPVVIENDVGTLTIAERWFGAGVGERDFIVVTLGRGIGLGMILNGRPYRGTRGQGGEFGHTTIERDGPLCACGKRGCLEAIAGEATILQAAGTILGREVALAEVAALARSGQTELLAIFRDVGDTLGLALANIVNVLNPTLIIVAGEGAQALDLLSEPMQRALTEHSFDGLSADLRFTVELWGDDAWARGAASLLLEELLTPRPEGAPPGTRGRLERELVTRGSTGSDAHLW